MGQRNHDRGDRSHHHCSITIWITHMIKVSVMGPRGGSLDHALMGYTMMAVQNFAYQLGISRFKTRLTIRMHHQFAMASDGTEGLCSPQDDPRHFIVDVCLYGNWLATLAHEMVHVKQYLRKEINYSLSKWKGKDGFEDVNYWEQPWEIEARKLQMKLVTEFDRLS